MKNIFLITIFVLSMTFTYGQTNCKEETIQKLQGVWLEGIVGKDSIGILIRKNHCSFQFKYWEKEPEYWNLEISDHTPTIDTVRDCRHFAFSKSPDNKIYFEILNLSDSSLTVIQSFSGVRSFKKIKREPKAIRELAWGEWADENTIITLKSDSTFSVNFHGDGYEYYSTGKFRYDGEKFVLKDSQTKTNKLPFDRNNEIHLYYDMFGLWLKETHMILVKMK